MWFVLLALACSAPSPAVDTVAPIPGDVPVYAASSLTDVFPKLADAAGVKATFDFDSSSRLAKQIDAGAPADVFVSADEDWMNDVEQHGLVEPGTRVDVAGNTLVVVVKKGGAFHPATAGDLATAGHLALAGEAVPAGKYARAALKATNAWDSVKDHVVEGDTVRATLAWVSRGEAEAAVVYATDAKASADVEVAFVFPEDSHPKIIYAAAVVKGSKHADDARKLLAGFHGDAGTKILADAGFTAP